jgi:hypothetical protein
MKFIEIAGLIGVFSVVTATLMQKQRQHSSSLDAETIGDYFDRGLHGFIFKLSNGKVLKIVSMGIGDVKFGWRDANNKQSNFIDEYIQNTKSGVWEECKVLPKYYYYNEGYASQELLDELEDEGNTDWDIDYNDEVAAWVTDDYNTVDVKSLTETEVLRAKTVLHGWGVKYGVTFGDLHDDNYGIDENGGIVFFDFSVNMQ